MQDDRSSLSDTEEDEESPHPQKPSANPEQVLGLWVYNVYTLDRHVMLQKISILSHKRFLDLNPHPSEN